MLELSTFVMNKSLQAVNSSICFALNVLVATIYLNTSSTSRKAKVLKGLSRMNFESSGFSIVYSLGAYYNTKRRTHSHDIRIRMTSLVAIRKCFQ